MSLFYSSGEEVRVRDRVLYMGAECDVESVADPEVDPGDWYVTEYGAGILLTEAKGFGRVFVVLPDDCLAFVSRASAK